MLKNKKIFLLLIFISVFQTLNYSQGLLKKEIVVTNIAVKCIDTTYTLSPNQTRVYPPRLSYIKDKLVYEIEITIKLNGAGFIYNKPLALSCYLPENESKTIIVNQELFELTTNESYEYLMVLKTKQKGWAKIVVGEWDDHHLRINYFGEIKLIDSSFYID